MIASIIRHVDLGDGQRTTLEQWGESGPVLLCIHGISSSRRGWARTADAFAASHRVFAYDQRGHGDSADVLGPMTLERSVLDLAAVAAAIGDPVAGLIGHSWGGGVALAGAARIAAHTVVAIDPLIRAEAEGYAELVEELRPVLASPTDSRANVVREMYSDLPPVEIDAKVHALRKMTIEPLIALGVDNDVAHGGWDLRERLVAFPLPLLLLLADPGDSVVVPEDVRFARERGGPNVRVEVIEGASHSLQRSHFDRYVGLVTDFLGAANVEAA